MKPEIILLISAACIFLTCTAYVVYLIVSLFYMQFKIEKYPKLVKIINDVVDDILKTEKIHLFLKSYEELNEGLEEEEHVVGRYVFILDDKRQQELNEILLKVESLEKQYKMPLDKMNTLTGNNLNKEDFAFPHILLLETLKDNSGLKWHYHTMFHELGHHFAIKDLKDKQTEQDADKYGKKIIKEKLPLFCYYIIPFREKGIRGLSLKEHIKANIQFLRFYTNRK